MYAQNYKVLYNFGSRARPGTQSVLPLLEPLRRAAAAICSAQPAKEEPDKSRKRVQNYDYGGSLKVLHQLQWGRSAKFLLWTHLPWPRTVGDYGTTRQGGTLRLWDDLQDDAGRYHKPPYIAFRGARITPYSTARTDRKRSWPIVMDRRRGDRGSLLRLRIQNHQVRRLYAAAYIS